MSYTLDQYKKDISKATNMYYGYIPDQNLLNQAIDYSISKRYKESNVVIENDYKKTSVNMTLLALSDYILDKQPIVTSYGTLFAKHGTIPNPLIKLMHDFLDLRSIHKKEMFKFPKHSDMFEYYNLLQILDKGDNNALN